MSRVMVQYGGAGELLYYFYAVVLYCGWLIKNVYQLKAKSQYDSLIHFN